MHFIYKITSPTGKIYIGQTKNIKNRFNNYKNLHCKDQSAIYNSLLKYGSENHKFEVLLNNLTAYQASNIEIELIKHYKYFKNISLNICAGGSLGPKDIGKKVYQFDLDGNFIKEYPTIISAALATNQDPQNIKHNLYKKSSRAKEFIFSFEKYCNKYTSNKKVFYEYDIHGNFIKEWKNNEEFCLYSKLSLYAMRGRLRRESSKFSDDSVFNNFISRIKYSNFLLKQ